MKSKWIKFELTEAKPKTCVWKIIEVKDDLSIGEIKWHSGWRQYLFFPYEDTIWSWDCLRAVSDFIKGEMESRNK